MNIKKGDQVKILQGKDRGKTGTVLKVFPAKGARFANASARREARFERPGDGKISVEGLNLYKKRVKPKRQGQKGEVVLVPRPFPVSKAQLICTNCKQPARIGHRIDGNLKVRYCKKCKAAT